MRLKPRPCLECGLAFSPVRHEAEFCADPCRDRFQKRRRERGADLYDAFMASRFERGAAKEAGLFSLMMSIAAHWREQDRREREGRRSWTSMAKLATSLHRYRAKLLSRNAAGIRREP